MVVVYIENLMFSILILLGVLWFLWYIFTKWIYVRRYKPENDRSKKGEDHRKELERIRESEGGESGTEERVTDNADSSDTSGQESVQVPTPDDDGEDGNGIGKSNTSTGESSTGNGKTFKPRRNPFRRR